MKRTLHLFVLVIMITSVAIVAGCQGESSKDFAEVGQRLSNSIKQIDKQPGILLTGFAADPKEKLFKVGVEYDPSQISNEQLIQIVTDYLSHAASNSPNNDWREMLKPYRLRIEELGDAKAIPVLAEKDIGKTELTWLFR